MHIAFSRKILAGHFLATALAGALCAGHAAAQLPVSGVTTSTVMTSSDNPARGYQPITFTVTVTGADASGAPPSGTVDVNVLTAVPIADDRPPSTTKPYASCPLLPAGNGSARCTTSPLVLGPGTYTIAAGYNGDASHAPSTDAGPGTTRFQQQVGASVPAATISTTAFSSSANPAAPNQPITFSATVTGSPGGAPPAGQVDFFEAVVTADGSGNGEKLLARCDLRPDTVNASNTSACLSPPGVFSAGVHNLFAFYYGDPRHRASSSAFLSADTHGTVYFQQVVHPFSPADTSTVLASSANPSSAGQPVTFMATVTTTGMAPGATGQVSFFEVVDLPGGVANGQNEIGSCVLPPVSANPGITSACASGPVTFSQGTHRIFAYYFGDIHHRASNSAFFASGSVSTVPNYLLQQVVGTTARSAVTLIDSSANPSTFGQSVTLHATVQGSEVDRPTGTATFNDGASVLCSNVALQPGVQGTIETGIATCVVDSLTVGNHALTATYSGDAAFAPVTSAALPQTVFAVNEQMRLKSSINPARYGESIILKAIMPATDADGTITFKRRGATGDDIVCNAVPVERSQATICMVPGSFNVTDPVQYTASFSGDTRLVAELTQPVDMTAATLSAVASPASVMAGQPANLNAMVIARTLNGLVTFTENGTALSGCANLPLSPLPGAADTGVANCTVHAAAGAHDYLVQYASIGGTEQVSLPVNAAATSVTDYTDMWWAGQSENGWGVSITQHGLAQFIALFVYDAGGRPTWYVLPGGSWNAARTAYTGALYQPTSSPYSAYDASRFDAGGAMHGPAGTATITYTDGDNALLEYTINGVSGSKSIQRQAFATDDGLATLQVGDLWWGGTGQNGWGVNISQQGRSLFPVWFTYDNAGRGTWFAVPGGSWSGTTFTGDIYSTTGSAWLGVPYRQDAFAVTKVGSMELTFSDQNNATMTYVVNGLRQSKAITRQVY